MKKFKRTIAILLTILLAITAFIVEIPVFANEAAKFNIFRDAGKIDEFFAAIAKLPESNSSENYFAFITMRFGDNKMLVDGSEIELSRPMFVKNDGEIVLPVTELAGAVGAELDIDRETGNITVEKNGETTRFDSVLESDFFYTKEKTVSENDTVTESSREAEEKEEMRQINPPLISKSKAEEMFDLKVKRDADKVIITRPYQTKELILFVKNGKNLKNDYGAEEIITNNQGLYFLRYTSDAQTKSAHEAFKNRPPRKLQNRKNACNRWTFVIK